MLAYESAKKLAEEYYNSVFADVRGGVVLREEMTISTHYGWVFFCNTREFLETGSVLNVIPSSAPVLVDAASGAMHSFGTRFSVDHYLREYEREHGYLCSEP